MRKHASVLLFLLCAVLLTGAPALAAVNGTAHETQAGKQGVCSACHIPHGGSGTNRLWPVAPTTGLVPGVTGSLCASCHYSTGAYQPSLAAAAVSGDAYVYHAVSHGNLMKLDNVPDGNSLATSGLPYTGDPSQTAPAVANRMECSSCHDVHNDANRPFLRVNIEDLCVRCHSTRQYNAGTMQSGSAGTVGVWDNAARVGVNNPGSHPSGTDIGGDVGTNSPVTFPTVSSIPKMARSATAGVGTWSLGGHRTGGTTGGVTCVTCHAVHGLHKDDSDTTSFTNLSPVTNLLIIAQGTGANEGLSGRSVANGDGGPANALCEGCHRGAAPTGAVLYAGTNFPNPGASNYTHPVDDFPGQTIEAVSAFPANWPQSSTTSTGTNKAAICESCHSPHVAANNANRATLLPSGGPYILRASQGEICNQCHAGRITQHHPVGQDIASALSGAASYLKTGIGASLTNTLTCATCHIGASGGAHNWTGSAQVAINPNWRPLNNARAATLALDQFAAGSNPVTTENVSATCVDCHLSFDGSTTNPSPTAHLPGRGINAIDNAQYQILGQGTHFIGLFNATAINANHNVRGQSGQTINPWTEAWTATKFGTGNANGGWSRFGGNNTAPILVCESCHELQMGKNVGNHMLLSSFYEGQSSTTSPVVNYDNFCEACHGVPAGTHAMFSDNVGRTGTTLSTLINTTTRPWLAALAPAAVPAGGAAGTSTWITGGPGTGSMTCDSCHQVHDANTQSGTLILEAPNANVTGGTPTSITSANYYGGTGVLANRMRQQPPAGGSAGIGTMPDVSMFCDQCHTYRQ